MALLPLLAHAQGVPREILRGRVVSDSLKVENITVLNITSNVGAVTDNDGNFALYARPTDTLFFSSITFRSQHLPLKKEHFVEARLIIKMDVNVTVLDEVVIIPLTGDLGKDSQNSRVKNFNSPFDPVAIAKSTFPKSKLPQNTAVPSNESTLTGLDFRKISELIFGKRKKKDDPDKYLKQKSFITTAKELYTHHFFTQTLKIPHAEIGIFLTFCDKGAETAHLLEPNKHFELTDYLVSKSIEYLKKGE